MKILSKKSIAHRLACAIAFSLCSAGAFASGSESIAGGQTSDTAMYNAGKGVYADKFACSACPLASKSLNASVAKEVLNGTPKVQLSSDEQAAVSMYLKRRFKI
jgi:hypothetical protein